MRERWLFLLLCAFLAQLSSSDYAVDSDGSRLDTMRPDPSTEQIFYGDKPVNGSEFASGMAKIRRARSTKDELKAANETYMAEKAIELKLKEAFDAAHNASGLAEKERLAAEAEWKEADQNLTRIRGELSDATTKAVNADATFTRENNNQTMKKTALDEAEGKFEAANVTYTDLNNKSTRLGEIHEAKKKERGEAEAAERIAESDAQSNKEDLIIVQQDRKNAEDKWKKSSADLAEKTLNLNNMKALIQLEVDYLAIKVEKDNAEADKAAKYTGVNGLLPKAEATKSEKESRKNKIDNNLVLNNGLDWTTKTIEEGITEQGKLYDKYNKIYEDLIGKNSTDETAIKESNQERQAARGFKTSLEELKSLGFTGKIQDLKSQYATLKQKASQDVTDAENEITKINGEINKADTAINGINKRLTALAKGKTEAEIIQDAKNAKRQKSGAENKVNSANDDVTKDLKEFNEEKRKFPAIEKASRDANDTLTKSHTKTEAVKIEEKKAESDFQKATSKATKYETDKLKPAENTKKQAKIDYDASVSITIQASTDLKTAKEEKEKKKKEEKSAEEIEGEKRTAKEKAKDKKAEKDQELITALNKHKEKEGQVANLKKTLDTLITRDKEETAAQEQKEAQEKKDEQKRQEMVAKLTTGLGTAVGILIFLAVGGALVFVLIKRKRKAAKEKAKKSKGYYIDADNGLQIWRKDGEKDKYCVKGDNIKIGKEVVVHHQGRLDDTRHALEGDEGNKNISKITFGETVVVAHPCVKDRPESEDSVEVSEDRGTEGIWDAMPERPDSQRYKKEQNSTPEAKKKSSKSKRAKEPNSKTTPSSGDEQDKKKK